VSPNTGIPIIFSTTLPPLNAVSNPWVAPATQPIYDINTFHQSYAETDDKFSINADGTITAKKLGKKISSPAEWTSAAQSFGLALSSAALENQFEWSHFMLYIQHMTMLFSLYQFTAVVEFDRSWRRWRRAFKHPWSAINQSLRDSHLLGKALTSGPRLTPIPSKPGSAPTTQVCLNFSRSSCSRGALCKYSHKCARCHTTFPSSSSTCPCVAGTLPPGCVLPAGVTFGK
jgi:hypothetical protein